MKGKREGLFPAAQAAEQAHSAQAGQAQHGEDLGRFRSGRGGDFEIAQIAWICVKRGGLIRFDMFATGVTSILN